ncbi:hypothetical protein PCANC_16682 [Puccinia coronata f. sp. avenae]|uniref:Phospholipid-transporting ATPase n=1 Tax=Puccinia coronata f. sp. avenae TaxID=200324 RepID=A0A2N5UEM2_9BASI|nr:hypothetical protein PCANC_16682 [Puccinia coronata f. sp. avenae]
MRRQEEDENSSVDERTLFTQQQQQQQNNGLDPYAPELLDSLIHQPLPGAHQPTPPYGYYPHHSALTDQDDEDDEDDDDEQDGGREQQDVPFPYHDTDSQPHFRTPHSLPLIASTFDQDQNPASYGGGHPSNPRGTMQDIHASPSQRIYDPLYDDQSPSSAKSHSDSAAPFNTTFNQHSRTGSPQKTTTNSAYRHQSLSTSAPRRSTSLSSKYIPEDEEDQHIIHGIRSIPLVDKHPSTSNRPPPPQPHPKPSVSLKERLERIFSRQPKELTGERLLYLNDTPRNQREFKFISNHVSTTKYNIITFFPKFLLEQFSKYANLFFLFTACIQQIPNVSPTNPYTTIAPLTLVLLVAAFKEMTEDIKRGKSDAELNTRAANVLSSDSYCKKPWQDIKVGDIVRLESNEHFPADLILLSSSEPDGLAYIETSNLDGETNLKIKQAHPSTAHITSPQLASSIRGQLRSEQPNNSLYTYEGTMTLETSMIAQKQISISPDQMLLRGAQLRNTAWMYGLVVFTGHETKLMRNATAAPIKRTAVERMVNVQIVFLFIILLVLSVGSSIGSFIRTYSLGNQLWYIMQAESGKDKTTSFIEDILTFIILYNNLIPISLIVTMEVVKYQQAALINSDLDMYYPVTDTAALCRTSSLVEELGQIDYVFSDKTGTLTRNVMEFRQCSIAGVPYSDIVDENRKGEIFPFSDLGSVLARNDDTGKVTREFLTLLATCHTVIPEEKDGKIIYQASSPDEAALVAGAEVLNYGFKVRKPQSIMIEANGVQEEYQVLNILEFNSTRKRMSSIIRAPDGRILLYCKGADTVILERCASHQPYKETTLVHLEEYATEGLRTLCIAMREIPEQEYQPWSAIYERAAATVNGRTEEIDKASELIEKNLFLLGATAIEDKLQEGVPDTIYTLQQAGIKVWVLTGDRQETAINIGLSCRLISESMNLVIVNEESADATADFIHKRLLALRAASRDPTDSEDLALIIDGKSLGFALDKSISKPFLELAVLCKAVVCCRVSPLQKALVVKLVKKNIKGSITLAIGDGANDVSMIQAAHVGVGISGVEGLQAARSADVAISQFRFLKKLLLVHGTWSYVRLTKLILYSFYKNITLYLIGFYFSFANGFSGQVLFESWTLTFYNVLFTVMPPFVLGVLDQFVSARMLDRYPELYTLGQRNIFFTRRIFWQWVATAVYHSVFIFFVTALIFKDDLILHQGWISGQWLWGTTTYLITLLTVLGKAAIISDLWTKWTLLAIPGSFALTLFILPLYASTAPHAGISKEYYGLMPRMLSSSVFYFSLLLIPVGCLARDLAWKGYKRLFRPEAYHIVQEIQKFNLPDYRPRMEQFQKAIKKVRAVQRLRRNRGFAFSQTEEGQEQLIRSYDTTIKKAKG